MKNIFSLLLLVLLSLTSYARTYYIFTATKDGNWNISGTWKVSVRNDNIWKDKFIIPASIMVLADDEVNSMGYDEVELEIHGKLKLAPSSSLHFGNSSRIEISATGTIEALGASQQIYIGNVSKYKGHKNKTLRGPLYADFSTGIAPEGFSTYSVLPVTMTGVSATLDNDILTLQWSALNDMHTRYEIEAYANGRDWLNIGAMDASQNSEKRMYIFNQNNPPAGFISYRLKLVKPDGRFQYSNTVSVKKVETNGVAKVFIN